MDDETREHFEIYKVHIRDEETMKESFIKEVDDYFWHKLFNDKTVTDGFGLISEACSLDWDRLDAILQERIEALMMWEE